MLTNYLNFLWLTTIKRNIIQPEFIRLHVDKYIGLYACNPTVHEGTVATVALLTFSLSLMKQRNKDSKFARSVTFSEHCCLASLYRNKNYSALQRSLINIINYIRDDKNRILV